MSASVEDSGGRDVRRGTGLASGYTPPGHAPLAQVQRRGARPLPRIPTSPVTAPPQDPESTPSGSAPSEPSPPPDAKATGTGGDGHHHHVLIEADEDRWAWRRRIRQNPHQLRVYRVGVGFAGLLLICLGLVTGPLPGPGGIPLVLLGLAIWSSEFEWAYRLRQRFKREIKRFRGWPTGHKVAFWAAFFAVCAGFGYTYLLVLGVPFWVPDAGAHLLGHLPGV